MLLACLSMRKAQADVVIANIYVPGHPGHSVVCYVLLRYEDKFTLENVQDYSRVQGFEADFP